MLNDCTETATILEALIFGAGDACVMIDLWSILQAFGAFMVLVIIAQFGARRLWARLTRVPAQFSDVHDPQVDNPIVDDPNYQNSAIRSSKR